MLMLGSFLNYMSVVNNPSMAMISMGTNPYLKLEGVWNLFLHFVVTREQ